MRIFVAGATGVLGRPTVRELVTAGHDVTGVARSAAGAAALRSAGAEPVAVDLFDAPALRGAVRGHDAVVNLATHIPPTTRMARRSAWEENDRLRNEASRHLVDAALAAGAGRYVQESVTFLYADGGDRWLDESAPVDAIGVTASALSAEREAARFTASGGAGTVLRFAQLVSADSMHLRDLVPVLRRGWLPLIGDHDGYESHVHADDAARAVAASLAAPAGTYNVADADPLTRREHAEVLTALLERPVRLPPAVVGRLPTLRVKARSLRISSGTLQEVSPWTPRRASMRQGWADVLAELREVAADAV